MTVSPQHEDNLGHTHTHTHVQVLYWHTQTSQEANPCWFVQHRISILGLELRSERAVCQQNTDVAANWATIDFQLIDERRPWAPVEGSPLNRHHSASRSFGPEWSVGFKWESPGLPSSISLNLAPHGNVLFNHFHLSVKTFRSIFLTTFSPQGPMLVDVLTCESFRHCFEWVPLILPRRPYVDVKENRRTKPCLKYSWLIHSLHDHITPCIARLCVTYRTWCERIKRKLLEEGQPWSSCTEGFTRTHPLNCCFPVMHHLSVQVRVPRGAEAKPGAHNWWSTDNPAAVWVSFILLQHVSQCLHRHQGSYGILLSWYKPWSVCTVLWIRSSSSSLCIPYQQHHIFTPDVEASGRSILIKQIFNPKDVKKVEECSRALKRGNNTRCLAHFLCPSLGFPWIRTR